jgi:hypothetical protein
MRIKELSLNPAKAFSSGFDKASDTVDKAFTPSQWGKGNSANGPSSGSTKSNKPTITLEKYQVRDAEGIMQAVVKGDVSVLTQQQTELARDLLTQIQKL